MRMCTTKYQRQCFDRFQFDNSIKVGFIFLKSHHTQKSTFYLKFTFHNFCHIAEWLGIRFAFTIFTLFFICFRFDCSHFSINVYILYSLRQHTIESTTKKMIEKVGANKK